MAELLHGDCTILMQDIPDDCVDMVLCDLPYGVTRNEWDTPLDMIELWKHYCRIVKEDGAIVLFASGMFTAQLMVSNPSMWRYNLIWQKNHPTGFLNAKKMPMRAHEDICVFYRKLPTYNPQMGKGKRVVSKASHQKSSRNCSNYGKFNPSTYDSTDRYPTSVLSFGSDTKRCAMHPTQKPVALCEWLIRTYTNECDTVLDNCMGSGSTGVAAANCGREFIGIEADGDYFLAAKKRIDAAYAQMRLPIHDS